MTTIATSRTHAKLINFAVQNIVLKSSDSQYSAMETLLCLHTTGFGTVRSLR